MFLVGLISWWYGRGFVAQWNRTLDRFKNTLEFFSIAQLITTLFAPFRQISASGSGDGSFGGALRGFIDKLISRIIGGIVRSFTVVIGVIVIMLQACYEAVIIVGWWLVPLLPIIGASMYALGWVPTWT